MKFRIFISSVQKEFAKERRAIAQYIRTDALFGKFFEVFLFEETPAANVSAQGVYLKEARKCDVYLGLIGARYGYECADGISPTEDVAKLCAKSGLPAPGFTEGVDFRAVLMRKKDGALSNEIHAGAQVKTQVETQVATEVATEAQWLWEAFAHSPEDVCTLQVLMRRIGIAEREDFRKRYLRTALKLGLIEMTQPDSPRSPTQKYRLTAKGRDILSRASQNKAAEATAEVSEET